ncbi:hypothetical protein ACTI_62090 [Actinoplanes sp. OR16]|uniref:hypothetical protein n=1 Tax=Actinoplanes sp. OR16 TaxID=946334 RepID=UPI000F70DB3D|nr:hypothetical protein [Actinoplanes sp. OR16]BBH69524.1 hypothetical protein ACTI_62090 [Actinoplanes sp. OR16]
MVSSYGGRHVLKDTWIPVERRWLGLDRRTLLPGLVVLGIALLLRTIIPLIDQAVPGGAVIEAGQRLNLNAGLTVAPPAGWQLTDGILVGANTVQPGAGSATAAFGTGGVGAQIQVANFSGDANALLDQLNRNDRKHITVTSDRATITAAGGVTGVAEQFGSTSNDGILAAYTFPDGRGMSIEVVGTANQLAAHAGEIDAVLRSVTLEAQK